MKNTSPSTSSDDEPDVRLNGYRITPADVSEALRMLGEDAVEAYASGRMPKAEAYEIARYRLRQISQLESSPPRPARFPQ